GNSADYSQTHDSVNGVHLPLDERLAKIEYGGEFGISQAMLELPIDRLKSGIPVKGVIEECMALVRSAWEKLPADHPERSRWDWHAQRSQIEASCYGFIKKECSEQPRLIDTLPDHLLKTWREIENRGGSPILLKRRYWGVEDTGPAESIPDV